MKKFNSLLLFVGMLLLILACNNDDENTPRTPEVVNSAPKIEDQSFNLSEATNQGEIICQITAIDDDNDELTFFLMTNDDDLFDLSAKGVLSLSSGKRLSFQEAKTHTIVVTVSDGKASKEARITLNITKAAIHIAGNIIKWVKSKTGIGSVQRNMAAVWKGGTMTLLSDGEKESAVYEIYVSPLGDVYACGYEKSDEDIYVAKFWKNGVGTSLTDGTKSAFASGIYVSGNDVYVAGSEDNEFEGNSIAKFWKNGTPTALTDGTNDAIARDIFVDSGDVYVSGKESNGVKDIAKVWKNGVSTALTDGKNDGYARDIFVLEGDVYVAGRESNGEKDVAKFWKNGTPTILTDGENQASAIGIHVIGENVYLAGYKYNGKKYVATSWKNKIATSLTDGLNYAFALGVFVFDKDVYVVGNDSGSASELSKTIVWKNNQREQIFYDSRSRDVFLR